LIRSWRTLEENLLWVRTFDTVEALRQALLVFRETTNATWLIERHGFRPPAAIRREQFSSMAGAAWEQAWCLKNWGRYSMT
jgi:hypothetical protein